MLKRHSKKREAILAVLKTAKEPLSAAAISVKLPTIDLVTIYRNLELFTQARLVRKFHFSGSEAHYEFQSEPHHHAICSSCDRVVHFKAPDKKIIKLLGLDDFLVEELEVIARGKCS